MTGLGVMPGIRETKGDAMSTEDQNTNDSSTSDGTDNRSDGDATQRDADRTANDRDDATAKDGESLESLRLTLGKVSQERRDARDRLKDTAKALKDAEGRLATIEGKDRSDVERLTAERDQLKADAESTATQLRSLAVTTALTTAATKAGARYPDLIVERLSKRAEIDETDEGLSVTNADDLVNAAKAEYPDLFRHANGRADGAAKDQAADDANVRPGLNRMQFAYANESKTSKRSR